MKTLNYHFSTYMKQSVKRRHGFLLRRLTFMAGILLLGSASAYAQQQDTIELTLQKALNYALANNQDAKKAQLNVENSQYQIDEYRGSALPNISGFSDLNYNPILMKTAVPGDFVGKPGETFLVTFGQKWNADAGIVVNQILFNNSVFTGLKAARTARELAELQSQLTEEQVIEQVANAYYSVLVQRQQMGSLDSTISHTKKIRDILNGLYENGLAKRIDVDRLTVSYSNLTSQRTQLLNGVQLLENQLKFFMGMPIQTPIYIPDADLSEIHPAAPGSADLDPAYRTEMQLLQAQEQLYHYQKGVAKSEYMPVLSFTGNYSYQGLGDHFPIFGGKHGDVNWFGVGVVGLKLQVPLFNGFATRARIRQVDISLKKVKEDIDKTRLALNLDMQNAITQINNSIITLESQKKNMKLAEQVYSDTQNNYNFGLASLTDLLQSETSLTDAQTNYSKALIDYKIAEIQLIKSQGNLKILLK